MLIQYIFSRKISSVFCKIIQITDSWIQILINRLGNGLYHRYCLALIAAFRGHDAQDIIRFLAENNGSIMLGIPAAVSDSSPPPSFLYVPVSFAFIHSYVISFIPSGLHIHNIPVGPVAPLYICSYYKRQSLKELKKAIL